jgi:uncharacterized protein
VEIAKTEQEQRVLLLELANYRMPFGKYRGRLLIDLPEAYLVWFSQKGFPEGKLGMLLESALSVRMNGLEHLVRPLIGKKLET